MNKSIFSLCLIVLITINFSLQAQQCFISSNDFYHIKNISDCQISPDGKYIAYIIKKIDKESNKYYSNIWIIAAKGGDPVQLTMRRSKDTYPRWSPDSKYLSFVSNRSGKNQIWLIAISGGEAWTLTDLKTGAYAPTWSPDAKKIAFLSKVKLAEKTNIDKTVIIDGKEYASDVFVIKNLKYRYGVNYFDKRYSHLFVISLHNNEIKQLTTGNFHDTNPAWSPDSKLIAFSANRYGDKHFDDNSDIFTVPANGGKIQRITSNNGPEQKPLWSKDGKNIFYTGKTAPNNYAMQIDIFVVDYTSKKVVNLTKNFDRTIYKLKRSFDEGKIYFLAPDKGSIHLYDLTLKNHKVKKIIKGKRQLKSFDISKNKKITYITTTDTNPNDLFISELSGKKEITLTAINKNILNKIKLSHAEDFYYNGYQNTKIHGWIMKPADFSPDKKYPLIVEIHGGPHWYYGNNWFLEFQLLAANGYIVFYCNPRLSASYGQEFAQLGVGEWGVGDFEDIMAGVEYVSKSNYINTSRMGVTGGSYGGFMTNWIISHTNLFNAAVTQRSLCNLVSFYGTTDIQNFIEFEFGSSSKNFDLLYKYSPVTYAEYIKTPLLIIHSELDYRIPISQAEELFTYLKRNNVETEFVRYPDEGHELSRSGQPIHRVDRYNRIISWFNKFLK